MSIQSNDADSSEPCGTIEEKRRKNVIDNENFLRGLNLNHVGRRAKAFRSSVFIPGEC